MEKQLVEYLFECLCSLKSHASGLVCVCVGGAMTGILVTQLLLRSKLLFVFISNVVTSPPEVLLLAATMLQKH